MRLEDVERLPRSCYLVFLSYPSLLFFRAPLHTHATSGIIRFVLSAEIIIVGNEVLMGLVQDTNSNYLCRAIRGAGGSVRHIAVVADENDAVAAEISFSLARNADLIITCGGLGPTDDDLTLAAIANACGLPLVSDAAAVDFILRRYSELTAQGFVASDEMTDARLKMARFPEGGQMIHNPVGTAPAVMLTVGESRILSLPGVPAEMKGMIEGPLQGFLPGLFGGGAYIEEELSVRCGDESALAPLLRAVANAHPGVYVKSHAGLFGAALKFRVTLSATSASAREARDLIERAREDLLRELADAGLVADS